MESINYTFIIPHKNIPDLLRRCLDSIPRREDVQIIVVDDNSDPEKVDFGHFPEVGEPCVEVYFTKEGKGAGYARNVGLEHAKGKWLLFADADDFYVDGFLITLDKYLNSKCDMIYFLSNSIYSDTNLPATRNAFYNELVNNYSLDNKSSDIELRYRFVVPWCKMIRKELVDNSGVRFEEIRYGNDVMFSTKVACYAQNIDVLKKPLYCVTISAGSLINHRNRESLLCRYKVLLKQNAFLRSIGESEYQSSIYYSLLSSLQYGLRTFLLFVNLAMKSKADFFIVKRTAFSSLFKRVVEFVRNRKYIECK